MKDLYNIAGISKQALWQHNKCQEEASRIVSKVVGLIEKTRVNHKRMGCRRIYYTAQGLLPVGRDLFEQIGFANGYKLKIKKNVMKTTWSQRVEVYPNLIEGMVLNGINQVWQSDIFYCKVEETDYYGISIEDVYSRKLLALHLSKSLAAEQNVKALRKALQARKGSDVKGCVFHSDRGSQYISESHKTLLKDAEMRISMCKMPQENAYVERVQGTMKYEYLFEHKLTHANLHKMTQKILHWYNDKRPHSALKMMTPTGFEKRMNNLIEKDRPEMKIYQGFSELLTKKEVINKKKKEAKKKKSTSTSLYLNVD